jgi:phosphoribosyl 1,2-cyclic phosphodiesterase
MRFASLGSGSRGNATLIEAGATRVLLDCGFSLRETAARLRRLGRETSELSAILVTHEHADHLNGVGVLAREHRLPVWMTPGTHLAAAAIGELPEVRPFNCHEPFAIGDLEIHPFPVPHDAREPCQFVFSDGAARLGVLTDTGEPTACIEAALDACDALLIECNHDRALLRDGPYPEALKQRIAGRYGHLDNDTAAQLLTRLDRGRLQTLVALHLSETNNRPQQVRATLSAALGCDPEWIAIADQERGLGWRDLGREW